MLTPNWSIICLRLSVNGGLPPTSTCSSARSISRVMARKARATSFDESAARTSAKHASAAATSGWSHGSGWLQVLSST